MLSSKMVIFSAMASTWRQRGVNVAARVESLADPGGVFISQSVFDQISGKIDTPVEDLGEHTVKNIPRPVHVFRMLLDGADLRKPMHRAMGAKPRNRKGVIAAAAYAQVGRIEDAKWEIEELRNSGFNKGIDVVLRTIALQRPVDIERYRDGLRKAGLPEN